MDSLLSLRYIIINKYIFSRSGFQISRKSLQHERNEKVKVFTETGKNEPSMQEVMNESTSFLAAEESRQASVASSGHYKITPLHKDNVDFETNMPEEAMISYVQDNTKGTLNDKN